MRFDLLLAAFAMVCTCNTLSAGRDLTPRIAPGYSPADAKTEEGIWMELKDYERAIKQSALLVKDESLNEYVKSTACRIAGDYCDDLRVYVIRNPNFNASMTANGIVQVWTGLLVRVSSEDELAAVLGHELAHYTQLHTLERLRRINKSLTAGSVFDLGLVLLTGASIPVGQMVAVASVMAFSRDQEEEADLLGVKFMAQANYDPRAAARLWKMIVEEEANAAVKRREPDIFSQTHPSSEDRVDTLEEFVQERYSQSLTDPQGGQRHVEMLNRHYMLLMEDQLDTNRFGRTEVLLRRHEEIGVRRNLIQFFQGEMYRQRGGDGDTQLAKDAYLRAVDGKTPVADAYLNLGYMYLKEDDLFHARENFRRYLELKPDADDRAMIEFYLQGDRQ